MNGPILPEVGRPTSVFGHYVTLYAEKGRLKFYCGWTCDQATNRRVTSSRFGSGLGRQTKGLIPGPSMAV